MKVLITGAYGQDAMWLAELLLSKGHEVHATIRRHTHKKHIFDNVVLHKMDLNDQSSIKRTLISIKPDYIFNLAAQSHVGDSFKIPEQTLMTNTMGVLHILEIINNNIPHCKIYQACTSEMFGGISKEPADENTIFAPQSPYGISKLAAFELVKNYRKAYGLFACSGILFNHESKYRGDNFLTKKVCNYVKDFIKASENNQKIDTLKIGNIFSKRDWGWAKEYVEAMWLMMEQDTPTDYVIGTGKTITIAQFVVEAFKTAEFDGEWIYKENDKIIDKEFKQNTPHDDKNWKFVVDNKNVVEINPIFYRPAEVDVLTANPNKAKEELKWEASDNSLKLIIRDMLWNT